MTDNHVNSVPATDTELGRIVVEKNLATPEEVEQCLTEQKRLAVENRHRPLADLLVEKGFVTKRQIDRVVKPIEELRPAQQIPGYQILAKLGSGAMATVFKAKQLSLDRLVAIKVLPKRFSENPEYVEGHTLYDELISGKVFSESEALDIIIQITRALVHAHERGLIHRDVKPKNIMITKDGVAKLADMGLARLAADEQTAQAEAGKAYGTPYYISPEQIRGEVDIDFRADIYSLGATLYHMVTGRVPFDGPTPVAVMNKHLKEPLIPPDHINPSLSVGIGEVVEAMMAKRREDRYASTSDLLTDLEAIARGEPPLQVHKMLDARMLSALTKEEIPLATSQETAPPKTATSQIVIYILLALLGVSIIINIIQAII